jgi:hypothetical protein
MSIGFGIFVMAVGAMIAFGIRDRSGAIDFGAAGVIIMLAGAAGIWLSFTITNRRRQAQAAAPTARSAVKPSSSPSDALNPDGPSGFERPHADPELPADADAESAIARHVSLDPHDSDLDVPTPDRVAPSHRGDIPVPTGSQPRGPWITRLLARFGR